MIYYLIGIVVVLALGLLCYDALLKYFRLDRKDKSPLHINTFDGKWSPYHPSVLFFEHGWNGFRYWMAETPYSLRTKPYGDRNECPSIHISNNGINWQEVPGLTNPLEDLSERQVKELDYFSDPCLVLGKNGQLECWYRLTERRGEKELRTIVSLRRRCTTDGVNWTPVEIMAQLNENDPDKGLGNVVVSPALLYNKTTGVYTMWFVNMETAGCPDFQGVSMCVSKDGRHWSDHRDVIFDKPVNQWHIDVHKIDGRYYMTIFDFVNVSIWESQDGLDFHYVCTPAMPAAKPFSVLEQLYKSCLIKDSQEYKLYMASHDGVDTYVSLMCGDSPKNLKHLLTDNVTFTNFINRYFYFQKRRIRCIAHTILSHFKF